MKQVLFFFALLMASTGTLAQEVMTPERLWQIGRVSGVGITTDQDAVVYRVTTPDIATNTSETKLYRIPLEGGQPQELSNVDRLIADRNVSPDGKYQISVQEVKVQKVLGKEFYSDLPLSDVYLYESLNYRHWDTWEDGAYSHLFVRKTEGGGEPIDIMEGEPYDCPQKPFGGEEDYTWSPDSKRIVYVTKRKEGTDYAVSTNTDLFAYNVETGETVNLTEGRMGYDTRPLFSPDGALAWLSMERDGYESDKNDIIVMREGVSMNLTSDWDGTVNTFTWSRDGKEIYFTAPVDGTIQLFVVDYPGKRRKKPVVRQLTEGPFDVTGIVGQVGKALFVTRTDMNHAAEIFRVDVRNGSFMQVTRVNDDFYSKLSLSKVEKRYVETTDGKQMLVWVIFPPDFDATRKYPTLLYCQGGPQSSLTQFYSFRWNFQLMAAQGYIVVAPARRGMPGYGVEWNEQISRDWGGQAMDDYLAAIDDVAREPYVDRERLGCVGASFGGYSAFFLAGIHEDRFKTFIAHDGVFNLRSMYGTTEELWFVNWDIGGPYWEKDNAEAQKSYTQFDPSNFVDRWDTPMLIIQGGKDFRVPIGQGLEAFQALQLRGIKSKLLFFPEENHWILSAQNALVWQREFFKWLEETL